MSFSVFHTVGGNTPWRHGWFTFTPESQNLTQCLAHGKQLSICSVNEWMNNSTLRLVLFHRNCWLGHSLLQSSVHSRGGIQGWEKGSPHQTNLGYGFSHDVSRYTQHPSWGGILSVARRAEILEVAGPSRSFPAAEPTGAMAPGPMPSWLSHQIWKEVEIGPGLPSLKTSRRAPRPNRIKEGPNAWGPRYPSLHFSSQLLEE